MFSESDELSIRLEEYLDQGLAALRLSQASLEDWIRSERATEKYSWQELHDLDNALHEICATINYYSRYRHYVLLFLEAKSRKEREP